jgi:uncharacterized protein YhbP (UPF0306 family)
LNDGKVRPSRASMTDLRSRLREFLEQHDTMALATIGPGDQPQAAAVFYAVGEDLVLYFLSSPSSRHCENITRDARAAATIQVDGQPWQEITGVQIEGAAYEVIDERQIAHAARTFAGRFAFLQGLLADAESDGPIELQGPLANSRFFVLRPSWIRLIDNTKGFGHKEETTLIDADGG